MLPGLCINHWNLILIIVEQCLQIVKVVKTRCWTIVQEVITGTIFGIKFTALQVNAIINLHHLETQITYRINTFPSWSWSRISWPWQVSWVTWPRLAAWHCSSHVSFHTLLPAGRTTPDSLLYGSGGAPHPALTKATQKEWVFCSNRADGPSSWEAHWDWTCCCVADSWGVDVAARSFREHALQPWPS